MLELFVEKLSSIEQSLKLIVELEFQSTSVFRTKKDVAQYLEVSSRTLSNWLNNGKLIENYHYVINSKGKVVFNPIKIIEFKQKPQIKSKIPNKDFAMATHPSTENILKGLNFNYDDNS